MPNHIANIVKIKGSDSDLTKIKNLVKSDGNDFDFNKIVPMPEELRGTKSPVDNPDDPKNKELREKYGADNWYDWALANWGTKWNSYNHEQMWEERDENGKLTALNYIFQTAWEMPIGIAEALSKQFPEAVLEWDFADEDLGFNCGTRIFTKGKVLDDKVYNGGDEAEHFANNVWGWEDDDEDDEDDEEHDNYSNPATITITKYDADPSMEYKIEYPDESWSMTGTKDEILAELSEHLDNMVKM